ncbi:MAG: arginine repressor [Clostridia bacterium]|nr:arginine repressor [Clostridia bacterium]MBQ2939493.1 arginine repressor [Clostridia bacterium]
MKSGRQEAILRLIQENAIDTQSDLLDLLRREGFEVTQATVSRDLKALRLVKSLGEDGRYRYTSGLSHEDKTYPKFHSLFDHAALTVDYAGNMVVIKCASGMAQGICAAMDALQWKTVVGTLAGDDTIFCVMRTESDAADMAQKLQQLK